MSDHESGGSLISTAGLAAVTGVVLTLLFLPLIITAAILSVWMGWAMVEAQRSWTRLASVFLLPPVVIWFLVGFPRDPGPGLLTSTMWHFVQPMVLLVQDKHNLILFRPLQRHGTSPLSTNQFMWFSLLGGYLLGLVLLFRKKAGRRPRWLQRFLERASDLAAAPVKRGVVYMTEDLSIAWKRGFVLLFLVVIGGILFRFENELGSVWRGCVFLVLVSLLLALPRIRKEPAKGEIVWIGKDAEQNPFGLSLDQLNHHVHVLGESGFGKSVFLMHILEHHIRNGLGFVFIDLKADRRTIGRLLTLAREAGRLRDMSVFSCANPEASATYNLCRYGNATEIKDKIIGGFVWSEPYYKKVAEEAVLALARAFVLRRETAGTLFTLADFHSSLSAPEVMRQLASGLPVNQVELKNSLNRIAIRLRSDKDAQELAGLRADLGLLIQSDFGHLLCSPEEGIDLFRAIQERKIVCISLEALQFGESAIRLGKMILQDLKAVAAQIMAEVPETRRKHFTVVIDEFAELASPQFVSFIRMARGSKIGIVMAHQEFADLEAISPEFRDQVVGNAATTVSFLQKNPRSAELVSDIAGTRSTRKITRQVDDRFLGRYTGIQSEREAEEYLIHPSEVKQLGIGECFVVMKYPAAATTKIRVNRLALVPETPEPAIRRIPGIQPVAAESSIEKKVQLSELF